MKTTNGQRAASRLIQGKLVASRLGSLLDSHFDQVMQVPLRFRNVLNGAATQTRVLRCVNPLLNVALGALHPSFRLGAKAPNRWSLHGPAGQTPCSCRHPRLRA